MRKHCTLLRCDHAKAKQSLELEHLVRVRLVEEKERSQLAQKDDRDYMNKTI